MDINNLRECKGDLRGKKWNEIDSYDWTIKKTKNLWQINVQRKEVITEEEWMKQ